MEGEEAKSSGNQNRELRNIFCEFLVQVVKFEELVSIGRRFVIVFQQSIEFLRRPSISESSDIVQSIIKANETRRLKSYVEAGCMNSHDSKQKISQLNSSLSGLQEHVIKAKGVIEEMEVLMEKAGGVIQNNINENDGDDEFGEIEFGSFMAVIYGMVKQDYATQVQIVSDLSLKSASGELDGYVLMWSLRPFVDDDVVNQALRLVR